MSNYKCIFSLYFYFTFSHVQPNCGPTGLKHVAYMQIHTSIGKVKSNINFNMRIAKRFFYIACLNNYMFQTLYRPSPGCTLSYYKANYAHL